jgi:hypothetical protein
MVEVRAKEIREIMSYHEKKDKLDWILFSVSYFY